MGEFPVTPDDPRLTAFALGELDPAETAAVEAAVNSDPRLQAEVEKMRSLGLELSAALAIEPALPQPPAESGRSSASGFSPIALAIGGLAAACLVAIVIWDQGRPETFGSVVKMEPFKATVDPIDFQETELVLDLAESLLEQVRQAAERLEFATAEAADVPRAISSRADYPVIEPSSQLPPGTIELARSQQNAAARREAAMLSRGGGDGTGQQAPRGNLVAVVEPMTVPVALDTGRSGYEAVRTDLAGGRMPDPSGVRIEELVNAFPYDYPPPARAEDAVAVHLEVAPAPWDSTRRLVRVGVRAMAAPAGTVAARQVRAQIQFLPSAVASYRRIETPDPGDGASVLVLPDATDFASGGMVTALYEVVPALAGGIPAGGAPDDFVTVTLEYRDPRTDQPRFGVYRSADTTSTFASASADFRLAAAAAGLGLILRGGDVPAGLSYARIPDWVGPVTTDDLAGRLTFLGVVSQARRLSGR